MEFITVTLETTREAADLVSLLLIEAGSEGTLVSDSADLEYAKSRVFWDYAPEMLPDLQDEKVKVSGFFDAGFDILVLEKSLERLRISAAREGLDVGSLRIFVDKLRSEDYENEWKKYYSVMEIGKIAIVPDWINYEGKLPFLLLNPGKAFGTGSHETTSMCLELMQDFAICGQKVLDVGCGSGILGLSALILGAKSAFLTDIDCQAVDSTTENAIKNGLTDRAKIEVLDAISSPDLMKERCGGKSDLLLANLTAGLLVALVPAIDSLVKTGGGVVVSGIINERADEVLAAFAKFKLVKKLKKGEWQAFSFSV